jgi:hypothetical protein
MDSEAVINMDTARTALWNVWVADEWFEAVL